MNPRKHSPRVAGSGTMTKFAFVGFETAEDALEGFRNSFNQKFKNDMYIVVRFRRIGKGEVNAVKEEVVKNAKMVAEAPKRKAEETSPTKGAQKKEEAKKSKQIKLEPKEEEDDDDEEEDDDEEDIEDSEDEDEVKI